jgi:hypothetical protein
MRAAMVELAAIVVPVIGIVVGILVMVISVREKRRRSTVFGDMNGTLKLDWTRTGRIDFYVQEIESASPQWLVLRVEEQKITENPMGQDMVQLRWRLATLDEAKELVIYWNGTKTDRNPERRGVLLKSA